MAESKRHWIFLRGLARHSLHWGPFLEHFKTFFPGDSIECLDLRGNGQLAHSPSYLSVAENVRDLRSRSELLSRHSCVHLLTLSLGSMVGVEWAQQHPDEIAGLITINTSDRGTSSFYERMQPHNYLALAKILTSNLSPLEIEQKVLQMTTHQLGHQKELAEVFSKSPPTSRSNFLRQLIAAGSYEFPEHKPRTEILMLSSQADRLVSPRCTQAIAEMWTLKAHSHPTAGHDLPLEAPGWVCTEIENWLKN